MNTKITLFGFVLLGLFCGALSHSYVTSPISRSNQTKTVAGCRGPSCLGPCDAPVSTIKNSRVASAARGDKIVVKWPRNNHAGGFIRFAWAPTDQSDKHAVFDNNVQQINCHEVGGCTPDDLSTPNGKDTGPADGSSRACTMAIKVPGHLTDGKWTLQWAWFGGRYSLGDYYSCVDYNIKGGVSTDAKNPVFVGGDFSNPNSGKCKFFNTDKLHKCVNEPCDNPVYKDNGKEHHGAAVLPNGQTPAPVTPAPVTPAPVTPSPQTPAPVTPSPQTPSGPSTDPVNCAADADFTACASVNSTQRCYKGVLSGAVNCTAGFECKYSPSSVDRVGNHNAYCVLPGTVLRTNEENGSHQLIYSLWVSMTLVVVCYLF